jgi:alanyl-tRNA synthetase
VRTVSVPGYSLELCGGCHVANTGEIGLFRLVAEKGVASGVRRAEAVTSVGALALARDVESTAESIAAELGVPLDKASAEARALRERVRDLEREAAKLRRELLEGGGAGEAATVEVGGYAVVAREVGDAPAQELRELADTMRDRLPKPGVAVLGTRAGERATLVVSVHPGAVDRIHAGKLVKQLAAMVGGGGGGRADFAQAGGKAPDQLGVALERVASLVAAQLGLAD